MLIERYRVRVDVPDAVSQKKREKVGYSFFYIILLISVGWEQAPTSRG